jgi:hypothetical protein
MRELLNSRTAVGDCIATLPTRQMFCDEVLNPTLLPFLELTGAVDDE